MKPSQFAKKPVPRPRRRQALDILAWALFTFGILAMLGVVFWSMLGEGDGDFRTWETIRRQVRWLWGAGGLAVGGPLIVWLVQRGLDHRDRSKPADPLEW